MIDHRPSFAVFHDPRRPAAIWRVWRVVLLGVLAVMVASCSPSSEVSKQKTLARGEKYLNEGKLNEAIIELRNALQVDPEFAPALHALGRAYERKSWFFDAEHELTRAQKLVPDSVPVAVDLGKVLLEIGSWEEAGAQAELILTRDPENRQALTIRAGVLLGQGKSVEAFALLKTTPPGRMPEVDRIRADILLSAGKFDEAEAAYRAARATKPDDLKTLLGLGVLSLEQRKFDKAKELYRPSREILRTPSRSSKGSIRGPGQWRPSWRWASTISRRIGRQTPRVCSAPWSGGSRSLRRPDISSLPRFLSRVTRRPWDSSKSSMDSSPRTPWFGSASPLCTPSRDDRARLWRGSTPSPSSRKRCPRITWSEGAPSCSSDALMMPLPLAARPSVSPRTCLHRIS